MLLLNRKCVSRFTRVVCNLHFNMLLLNPEQKRFTVDELIEFTFQYASIKPTVNGVKYEMARTFTFQYASIKPYVVDDLLCGYFIFTFQYASIKPHACRTQHYRSAEFTFQYASIKPRRKSCFPCR